MPIAPDLFDELLSRVDKPSRYLGNEVNATAMQHGPGPGKDLDAVGVRLALAFPDLYDIGLGNLGIHILYAIVNALPWAACERVFAPAIDLEKELRALQLPLFALESKDPLSSMDGLGFTLQSELTFTNILNMLDLGGIPIRAADRADAHPIVFAGGPAVFNPEPLAPFVDFFLIGDGEDAIVEIARVLERTRGASRKVRLTALSLLEGVYVPALYPFETLPDGQILPALDAPKIRKRITRSLDGATFPTDYIVPFTKQVHDRISLEVLRGCTQGCRFCQAGMTTRPVRERSLENLDQLLQRTLDNTGYEEVSLVSLSTCDYSRVRQLVENTVERARPQRVSVSLPSLRLDSFSVELTDMVAETRRSGITFAPEAASPRLRALINKWIPDEDLLDMSLETFRRGFDTVKLYFMIGLPTERDDDIDAIADLAIRTWKAGKAVNERARVNTGVSTFVPKPFTPFQWAAQIDGGETVRKQAILMERLHRYGAIKFGRHEPAETWLEGLVSRADRRAGDLIEAAWRKGCRFDAWGEHRRLDLWREAVAEIGYDVAFALRERRLDERLPWDHIDILIPKQWFVDDWNRAMELQHAPDCRHRKCHQCGVIDTERELCATMLRDNVKARKHEAAWVRKPAPELTEPPAVQRVVFRIARTGKARFLSHLEAMAAWTRALRRAHAPMAWSSGFHPHPQVAFAGATPQNEETLGDYMDVDLASPVAPAELLDRLVAALPDGFGALGAWEVPLKAPSLMSLAAGATYTVILPEDDRSALDERVAAVLERSSIIAERPGKPKKKRGRGPSRAPTRVIDVRPMIHSITPREDGAGLDLVLYQHEGKMAKVREILPLLCDRPDRARAIRTDTLVAGPRSMGAWASAAMTEPLPGPILADRHDDEEDDAAALDE